MVNIVMGLFGGKKESLLDMYIKNFKYTINNNNKLTLVFTGVPHADLILGLLEDLTGPLHFNKVTHRDRKAVLNGLLQLSAIFGPVKLGPRAVSNFVEKFAKYIKITKTNMSRLDRFILSFNHKTLNSLQKIPNKEITHNALNTRDEMMEMLRMLDPLIIFDKRITINNRRSDDLVAPVFSGIARLSLLLSTPINIDMLYITSFIQEYIFYRIGKQQPNNKKNNNQTTKKTTTKQQKNNNQTTKQQKNNNNKHGVKQQRGTNTIE